VVRHDDDDEGAREEQRTRRGRGEALRLRSSADGEREPEVERSSAGKAGTERTAVQQIVDGSRPAERRGTGAAPRVAQRKTTGCRGARQPRRELQTRGSSPERSRRARARWPGSGAAAATTRRWCGATRLRWWWAWAHDEWPARTGEASGASEHGMEMETRAAPLSCGA